MKSLPFRSWHALSAVVACLLASALLPARAQTPTPVEIEVSGVKFNNLRTGASTAGWLEIEVELNVKPVVTSGESKFLNRVKVGLSVGIEAGLGAARRVDFYRTDVEFVTLEYGRAFARFYVPPEVVKRDSLRNEVKYYFVELAAGGKEVPVARGNVSVASLANPEALRSFQGKVASSAGVNDGVLLPQHLTPFAFDPAKVTPSAIRNSK